MDWFIENQTEKQKKVKREDIKKLNENWSAEPTIIESARRRRKYYTIEIKTLWCAKWMKRLNEPKTSE